MAASSISVILYKNDGSQDNLMLGFQDQDTIIMPNIYNIVVPQEVFPEPHDWTREGYDFLEWNSQSNGSGESYFPGDEYTLDIEEFPSGNCLLYAIWREQRNLISKIQLPDNSIRYLSVDWQDISNKPGLTREQIVEIVEDLYPNATSTEVEDMVDDILENYTTVTEDMVEEILSSENGSLTSYAPVASPQLTGVPTAPTAATGTNTTQIATTAFVQQAIANIGNVQGVLYGN